MAQPGAEAGVESGSLGCIPGPFTLDELPKGGLQRAGRGGAFVQAGPGRHLTLAAVRPAGLRKILKVVGQVPDLPSCLPLTDNTRMLASILINKLYDDLRCDPERDHFRKICEEYIM